MSRKNKYNNKHLTLSQRIIIEKGLVENESFAHIARKIKKDPTTVSKEIKRHIVHHVRSEFGRDIPCTHRSGCAKRMLCDDTFCTQPCKMFHKPNFTCAKICTDYLPRSCNKLDTPPYVCNGCTKKYNCFLKRSHYTAKYADDCYKDLLISCREGINQTPVDIAVVDSLVSPLIKQGQSLAHIYANHAHEIPFCRRTLYNYIDKSVFLARNIDMRRRVRYKLRKRPTRVSITAREYRKGRTYDDFTKFLKRSPDISVVEMDTVIGKQGDSQVFLTMLFRNCSLMLIFPLAEKTSKCVSGTFDWLTKELGIEVFIELFPLILTDNGAEFQNPLRLEGDVNGEVRTKLFYCNPNSSWQKGRIEKNHTFIRLIIPKGVSLENISCEDTTLIMNHINSEARDSLNGCTPFKLSKMLLNNKLHKLLQLQDVPADDVMLSTNLLK